MDVGHFEGVGLGGFEGVGCHNLRGLVVQELRVPIRQPQLHENSKLNAQSREVNVDLRLLLFIARFHIRGKGARGWYVAKRPPAGQGLANPSDVKTCAWSCHA